MGKDCRESKGGADSPSTSSRPVSRSADDICDRLVQAEVSGAAVARPSFAPHYKEEGRGKLVLSTLYNSEGIATMSCALISGLFPARAHPLRSRSLSPFVPPS